MTADVGVVREFVADGNKIRVVVFDSGESLGAAAAEHTARIVREAIANRGSARVIFATGNSQFAFNEALKNIPDVDWSVVTAFHMDEYVGIDDQHPASFRKWIRERVENTLQPRAVHYLNGDVGDLDAECARYEALLREGPIDLVCMGIGENGHIAFNDPPVADFNDQVWVKVVELDEACRAQQVGEGHFASDADVPRHALSLTVPALIAPKRLQVVVPESRKAPAVRDALEGPIGEACPASILRTQSHAVLFLDRDSAALISSSEVHG
jgi:glucosamine-6-phosphate deaminase